jgi:hypothetical protein
MHAAKRSQECAERCTRAFTTVAVDFAHAIAIVITRPLMLTVIDSRMVLLNPVLTTIVVRVDDRPLSRNGFGENTMTRSCVAVRNRPTALFARFAADTMNNRWAVIVIGAVSRLLHPEGTRRADAVGHSGRDRAYALATRFQREVYHRCTPIGHEPREYDKRF